MKRTDNCKTCKREFEHKCHAHVTYCSKTCRLNGEWGRMNKVLNLGRRHTEEHKKKMSKTARKLKIWQVLLRPDVREKALLASRKRLLGNKSPLKGRKAPWAAGENNFNWKGGITSENYRQRRTFGMTMQKAVFERDNYTCQLCSVRGVNLQVDHIQSWAEYVDLRFSMDNCRTLCANCHYEITFGRPMPENVKAWGHNLLKGGDLI